MQYIYIEYGHRNFCSAKQCQASFHISRPLILRRLLRTERALVAAAVALVSQDELMIFHHLTIFDSIYIYIH